MRLIQVCRSCLKKSFDLGIVQLAELMSPGPSVIRGPCEIGFLDSKVRQVERSWFTNEVLDVQGESMSITAEAKDDGCSAVRAPT